MKRNCARSMAAVVLALVIALPAWSVAFGAGEAAVFTIDQKEYRAAGTVFKMDSAPFIQSGRTLVPVRFLALALGVPEQGIQWNSETQTVTLQKGSTTVILRIGSTGLSVNSSDTMMDVAPIIREGRTYLPARYVAEALGYTVSWDAPTRSVLVNAAAHPAAKTHSIDISGFSFNPTALEIKAGDTVKWTNHDAVGHTVTGDAFGSALLNNGESFSFTFTKPGSYTYHCSPHPGMVGTITVQ